MRKRETSLSANAGTDTVERPVKEASDPQRRYIRTLVDQIDWSELGAEQRAQTLDSAGSDALSMATASSMIDTLKELRKKHSSTFPKKQKIERPREVNGPAPYVEAGMYVLDDGTIVRVYFGQQSGIMLSKKLVESGEIDKYGPLHKWEYLGAAYKFVPDGTARLSIEDAAKFGQMTRSCAICARRLDVPESVDRGIGPVCFGRMENDDWLTDKQRERLGLDV